MKEETHDDEFVHSSVKDEDTVNYFELTFGERLSVMKLWPNRTTLKEGFLVDDLRTKFAITQKDWALYEVKEVLDAEGNNTGNLQWQQKPGIEFGLTQLEVDFLCERLDKLSEDNSIETDVNFILMCRKIMNLRNE